MQVINLFREIKLKLKQKTLNKKIQNELQGLLLIMKYFFDLAKVKLRLS